MAYTKSNKEKVEIMINVGDMVLVVAMVMQT